MVVMVAWQAVEIRLLHCTVLNCTERAHTVSAFDAILSRYLRHGLRK